MLPVIFSIIILVMASTYKTAPTQGKRTGITVLGVINLILAIFNVLSGISLLIIALMKNTFFELFYEVAIEIYETAGDEVAEMVVGMFQMILDYALIMGIISLVISAFFIFASVYGFNVTKKFQPPMAYGQPYAQPVQYQQPVQGYAQPMQYQQPVPRPMQQPVPPVAPVAQPGQPYAQPVQQTQPVQQPVQPEQPYAQPYAQPVQQSADQPHYEWYCATCGTTHGEDVKFCPGCGAARPVNN